MSPADVHPRRPIVAVIGTGDDGADGEADAERLGCLLVDAGFRVLTGGLGGIMAAASRGARRSARYREGDVIGVLPGYETDAANPFVDVVIATGLGHARNAIVAATADVVCAVGGRSGTLSEMALAWTLGRPVIAVGDAEGWARTLAGQPLDGRRKDRVRGPFSPEEAVAEVGRITHTGDSVP